MLPVVLHNFAFFCFGYPDGGVGEGVPLFVEAQLIGGLTPLVQVRDAYYGSRRFSVVRCETSRYRLKVYYSFCLFDDQEVILY